MISKLKSSVKLPRGVIKLKTGYNPNSSSIGSLVYSFPLAVVVLSVVLSFLASKKFSFKKEGDDK